MMVSYLRALGYIGGLRGFCFDEVILCIHGVLDSFSHSLCLLLVNKKEKKSDDCEFKKS